MIWSIKCISCVMRENISHGESFSHCRFTDFDDITLYSSHAFYDNIFAVARIVIIFTRNQGYLVNSSPHSAAYMRQWIGSALVQIMACRLFATKPLPEVMLAYWQPDSWEHTAVKFVSKYKLFFHENAYGNVVCENAAIFSRGDESIKVAWVLSLVVK